MKHHKQAMDNDGAWDFSQKILGLEWGVTDPLSLFRPNRVNLVDSVPFKRA